MIKQELFTNTPPRVSIIGVPISAVNMESCVDFLFANWKFVRGNYICVSNVHTTVMAHDNLEYHQIQSESLLSLPDGKPLSMIGAKQYPNMGRVAGVDLMKRIFEESKEKNIRHFFYGNTKENLECFIQKIKEDYPWINIAGYEPSVFHTLNNAEEKELINRINAVSPDIVWVSLGAPLQEEFCSQMEGKINSLMIGIGGAMNVAAGIKKEAPKWMKDICLEWLYRLIQEPKRLWKRYLVTNSRFIWLYLTKK